MTNQQNISILEHPKILSELFKQCEIEWFVHRMKNRGNHRSTKPIRTLANIREISSLSGFTEEKRMAECFDRIFGMSPGKYRSKYIGNKFIRNK